MNIVVSEDIENFMLSPDKVEARERLDIPSQESVDSIEAKNPVISIQDVYNEGSHTWESAIETAFARCVTAGGGTVFIPNGTYVLTGPFRETHSNGTQHYAQIVLPAVGQTAGADAVRIVGESPPSLSTNEYTGNIPNPTTGVIIQGGLKPPGAGGYQYSLIGSQALMSGGFGPWNWRQIDLENLTFRVMSQEDGTPFAMNMTGVDFSRVAMCRLKNVRIDVDTVAGVQLSPMGGSSVGLRMGDTTNWIVQECNDILVRGFRRGIDCAEHFKAINVIVTGCGYGIRTQNGHHPIYLENCGIQWCRTALIFAGSSAISGTVQIEGYVAADRWYQQDTYDVVGEGSSVPMGELYYARGQSGGGYRAFAVGSTVDTGKMRFINLRDPYGLEYWDVTSTDLTLNFQYPWKPVRISNASTGIITVPHLIVGTVIEIFNAGAGVKTLTAVNGDLRMTAASGKLAIAQGERRILKYVATSGALTYVDVIS